jgi:hypothetical protein
MYIEVKDFRFMIYRVIPYILILCLGCRTASKTEQKVLIAEGNKDVIVLSYLIRDHMRNTKSSNFTLSDILVNDTLGRITKNFSGLEVANWSNIWIGGYAVYFKFSEERKTDSIELFPSERTPLKVKSKQTIGRTKAQRDKSFDGEIHFYYPERHYHVAEIIVKKPAN